MRATATSPSNSPAASMCASIGASIGASVRAFACPCNCLAACLCLGISLYCSSLLRTPQASLPLPSSSETVQPPNDPNNSVFKNRKTQGIDHSIYKPKVLPSICIKYDKLTMYFRQMENNHYLTMTQAKSRDAVVGWLWCVYVGQDVPDYQAITGYS